VPSTLWFHAAANAAGEAASVPAGRTPVDGSVVDGAEDDVDGSVVEGLVVGSVVEVNEDDVDGSVVGGVVDDDAGSVVDGAEDDVDGSVVDGPVVDVGTSVVEGVVVDVGGWVVVVSVDGLCPASWVTMSRTAAPRTCAWLGAVVVVSTVEGAVAVDEVVLEVAFEISRPVPTSSPMITTGVSTCAHKGRAR
jgi:hypothetical protein